MPYVDFFHNVNIWNDEFEFEGKKLTFRKKWINNLRKESLSTKEENKKEKKKKKNKKRCPNQSQRFVLRATECNHPIRRHKLATFNRSQSYICVKHLHAYHMVNEYISSLLDIYIPSEIEGMCAERWGKRLLLEWTLDFITTLERFWTHGFWRNSFPQSNTGSWQLGGDGTHREWGCCLPVIVHMMRSQLLVIVVILCS